MISFKLKLDASKIKIFDRSRVIPFYAWIYWSLSVAVLTPRNNVSRNTLIILIDSEELVDQLRYTDRTIWLPSIRSVCAFTARWFNAGTDIKTRYWFLYLPFLGLVFRFSLWRRHYLIMILLFRMTSLRRKLRARVVGSAFR